MKKVMLLLLTLMTVWLVGCGGAEPQARAVTIEAEGFDYRPTRIEATVGEPLRLTVDNVGTLLHDWSIDEIPLDGEARVVEEGHSADHDMSNMETDDPAVHVVAAAGEKGTIIFTPSQAGTYTFYCTVEGHRAGGMVGEFVVEP